MIARVALLVALFMCTLPDEVRLLGFQEPNGLHCETAKPHCLINLSALTAVSLKLLILNIGGEWRAASALGLEPMMRPATNPRVLTPNENGN